MKIKRISAGTPERLERRLARALASSRMDITRRMCSIDEFMG
jgi:hypothetical protein